MPLGDYTKENTRKIAEEIGLVVAKKPDSVEICFIPDDNHGGFIKTKAPEKVKPGNIIDLNGNILGQHKGIVYYTIGQRKGLGLSLGKQVFVSDIVSENNTVVVGNEEDIFKTALYAEDVNFIPFENLNGDMEVTAKIRYSAKETPATISPYKNGVAVKFDSPQRAITKGQSVVFYDNDIVVGGGIIKKIL
jgi:tRNA-specific 2-thiouridylase